jgi:hypothetical protein
MTDATNAASEEEKKIPPLPPQRAPIPQPRNPFSNMHNARGGNIKGGSKIGTKIQKHSNKGR